MVVTCLTKPTLHRLRNRKIDTGWQKIEEERNMIQQIHKHDYYCMTAKEIEPFHSAHHMVKFDSFDLLPNLFKKHNLSIFPIKRGTYQIGHYAAYYHLDDPTWIKESNKLYRLPSFVETIEYGKLTSESPVFNTAVMTGMIHDVLGETRLVGTVDGRSSTGNFDYEINSTIGSEKKLLTVKNAQIEIDGALESPEALYLFEVKNNMDASFNIRQLYFPYRVAYRRYSKPIRPVFVQHKDNVFVFSVFTFDDIKDYSSIRLLEQKKCVLRE